MARPPRFELDELVLRPGTYFNPETEVLIVVDDTPEIDQAIFDGDSDTEGGDWVLVADEVPVDEAARDELLERFQVRYHAGAPTADADEEEDEDEDDDLEEDEDDVPELGEEDEL
jgi:hypothetical protein